MYIVSACLAGVNCKYNGGNNIDDHIVKLVEEGKAILVCPEQLGGLPKPRLPSEIVEKDGVRKVKTTKGEDVTDQFIKGAEETLNIAKMMKIEKAILKSRSPSCGYGKIYDGTFSRTIKDGNGFTADLLEKNGIKIIKSKENNL